MSNITELLGTTIAVIRKATEALSLLKLQGDN